MARRPDQIVDRSALYSTPINIPLWIGWLLRSSRLSFADEDVRVAARFANELGTSSPSVSKWERAVVPPDLDALAGYERILGLTPGALQALVLTWQRAFRVPESTSRQWLRVTQQVVSDAVEPAMTGDATGADWLNFTHLVRLNAIRLPRFLMSDIAERLLHEVPRAVESAYVTRYEAAARLRNSDHGDFIVDRIFEYVEDPDSLMPVDLLGVATEGGDHHVLSRVLGLLTHERTLLVVGAAIALENLATIGGIKPGEMRAIVPHLVEAYNESSSDPERHKVLSALLQNLPRGVVTTATPLLNRALIPVATFPETSREYHECRRLAGLVAGGVPDPMLVRLLFTALLDHRWVHLYCGRTFLMCHPLRAEIARVLLDAAENHPLEAIRTGARETVCTLVDATVGDVPRRWIESDDSGLAFVGLTWAAHHGHSPDADITSRLLTHPAAAVRRQMTYALGMTQDPLLFTFRSELATPKAAAWWDREGGRIVEPHRGVAIR